MLVKILALIMACAALAACNQESSPGAINSKTAATLTAGGSGSILAVTHCSGSGTGSLTGIFFDYVVATFSDGSQNISCTVTHPSPYEETAFAAYSATAAPAANAACAIHYDVDSDSDNNVEWNFTYASQAASVAFILDSSQQTVPLTCIAQ